LEDDNEEQAIVVEAGDDGDLKPSSVPKPVPVAAAPKEEIVAPEVKEDSAHHSVSIKTEEDAGKVQCWVSLLESKPDPNDKEAMTEWMMKVINSSAGGSLRNEVKTEGDGSQPPMKRFKE
jgi:hypothetical protein